MKLIVCFLQVWNFQNGHNLHKLESVSEAEVTGIFPSVDRKIIIAVGWSRKIAQYDDSDPDVSLSAVDKFDETPRYLIPIIMQCCFIHTEHVYSC